MGQGGEQSGGGVRAEGSCRMWIEGGRHGGTPGGSGSFQRSLEHGPMPEMQPIEDTDGQGHWPRNVGQLRDRVKCAH